MLLLILAELMIALSVNPRIVQVGATVHVQCRVPRNSANRQLVAGIPNYTESSKQLDGEESRVTFDFFFSHVPCVAEEVFCAVGGTREPQVVRQSIEVVGCDQ